MCGVNACSVGSIRQWAAGPSPRVRGERWSDTAAHQVVTDHPRVCGVNERCWEAMQKRNPDHPRVCGVNGKCVHWEHNCTGPSPRVRGEPSLMLKIDEDLCGPSPRVRGERPTRRRWQPSTSDHPRVCGVNGLDLVPHDGVSVGPSPRVRGEHMMFTWFCPPRRGLSLRRHHPSCPRCLFL